MSNLDCIFVYAFGNYIASILIAAHTANDLDRGDKPEEGEGYKSEPKDRNDGCVFYFKR